MGKQKGRTSGFADLTWSDLESWAGPKIVTRGRSYFKNGYVKELSLTKESALLAWVKGTKTYAVKVRMNKNRLESDCTCPYYGTCKHAVAVVLEYLDRVKKIQEIPQANERDARIRLIE